MTREALREKIAKAKLYNATKSARQAGLKQGFEQVWKSQIALKLFKRGFSVEDVSEDTGLPLETVKQLKAGEINFSP